MSQESKAEWLNRYRPDDEGLRFMNLTYTGNFTDLPPVPDGILGDRLMRQRMKTKIMEPLSEADVLRDEFTINEINDFNNYIAWCLWDMVVLRATEGVSGMIPRQEYEILAFAQCFYRYPEIMRAIHREIGTRGVMEIGAGARKEIGTKINCVHDFCIGSVAFGMGRCALLALEAIEPRDYVEESATMLKFMQRVLWAKRQDGYIFNSQNRYRCAIHDQAILDKLLAECEDVRDDKEKYDAFVAFNAAAELLAFFDHYDCRLGAGDTGPYLLPDGRILLVRDLFVNEEIYHWSDVCEELPYCYSFAIVINPTALGLREIRVNDIGTTFTNPKNYIAGIEGGAIFFREKWDTPMGEIHPLPIRAVGPHLEKIRGAILRMYQKTARMSRRELILNGIHTYFVGFLLPHLRKAGLYDYACRELNIWEVDQRIANYYYEIPKRNFAQTVIPQKIFSGTGYLPFPDHADPKASKYFWH